MAEQARVSGHIKGSITADTLVILKTARIEGDVTYGTLSIEEGALVEGNFSNRAPEPKLMLAGGTDSGDSLAATVGQRSCPSEPNTIFPTRQRISHALPRHCPGLFRQSRVPVTLAQPLPRSSGQPGERTGE